MSESQDQEWRRLTELYADKYDGELIELASSLNDLTEMAKTVLRDELRKRGLGDPLAPGGFAKMRSQTVAEQALDAPEADAEGKSPDYTWKVLLCECNDSIEAWQVGETLKRAGLDCWIDRPRFPSDLRGPLIYVAADQLDEARAVVAQPIPQDIIDDSREEIPVYAPPTCPACGAADPILLSTDPSNSWECESCGKEWTDPADDRAEAS